MNNRKFTIGAIFIAGLLFIGASIAAFAAGRTLTPVTMSDGDSLNVTCPRGSLGVTASTSPSALLKCAIPTATPVPATATATARPTATPLPPTPTPVPPTATPIPTATAVPPTATTAPTATAVPPTDTPLPPTATAGAPMTPIPGPKQAPNGNSMAMGLWNPNPKYDNCYNPDGTLNSAATARIKQFHDSFSVIGPDGKLYPTWHPPVAVDPVTGANCRFGHEHGKNPASSPNFPEIQAYYAYQGDIADSGLPFGYINEQLDVYNTATGGNMAMRHEDHVGNKVEWENSVPVQMSDPANPGPKYPTGVTCNYLASAHQGTSTHDAFENNLHGVFYMSKCSDGQDLLLNKLVSFGPAGSFTRICDAEGDRSTVITTGFDYSNPNYPGTAADGNRLITDRSCVVNNFLVPNGKWSMNFYEAWNGTLNITGAAGQPLVRGVDLLFDVENAVRYYNPGATHPETGADAGKYTNEGFSMDLCYEVLPNGNKARGGDCEAATNYGAIKGITWDDPRSAFKGTSRGLYFKPGDTTNAGGPTVWYTDPFGNKGSPTAFPGSVKQVIDARTINYSQKYGGGTRFTVPEVINRDYSNATVHGPN